jgi:hypothetical protein
MLAMNALLSNLVVLFYSEAVRCIVSLLFGYAIYSCISDMRLLLLRQLMDL